MAENGKMCYTGNVETINSKQRRGVEKKYGFKVRLGGGTEKDIRRVLEERGGADNEEAQGTYREKSLGFASPPYLMKRNSGSIKRLT